MKKLTKEPLTPPIKWAGGKRWLVDRIAKHYDGGRVIEPFCGACSVSLALRPKVAICTDLNRALINFWNVVREGDELHVVGKNTKKDYYAARDAFNQINLIPWDRWAYINYASLFYYLNRTCFNGLYRVNNLNRFNVPKGSYKKINYQTTFPEITQAVKSWYFGTVDFSEIETRSSDFVYVDPPYDDGFTAFTSQGFTWSDQERLAARCAAWKGKVVVSNSATPRIVKLYRSYGFKVEIIEAPRRISSDGNRNNAKEIFAYKRK